MKSAETCGWNDFVHGYHESGDKFTDSCRELVTSALSIIATTSSANPQHKYARGIVNAARHLGMELPKPEPPKEPEIMELLKYSGRDGKGRFRSMSRAEVLRLGYGDHVWFLTINGDARTCKINGAVRTWKRQPERIEVPIKYGMYEYSTFTASDINRLLIEID